MNDHQESSTNPPIMFHRTTKRQSLNQTIFNQTSIKHQLLCNQSSIVPAINQTTNHQLIKFQLRYYQSVVNQHKSINHETIANQSPSIKQSSIGHSNNKQSIINRTTDQSTNDQTNRQSNLHQINQTSINQSNKESVKSQQDNQSLIQ